MAAQQSMDQSSIKPLEKEPATRLMDNYRNEINLRLSGNRSIDDLLYWGNQNENKLSAFSVPVNELGVFNNLVGITKIIFSFGLEDAKTAYAPRLTVLIQGRNDNGTIQSDYYQLLKGIPTSQSLPVYGTPTTSSGLAVPKFLFDTWTLSWKEMSDSSAMKAKFCTIDVIDTFINVGDQDIVTKPLEKYIFNISDAINILYPGQLTISQSSITKLYLCMVSHIATNTNGNVENFDKARIGMVMGIAEKTNHNPETYEFISSGYDFSAPCPPTCP
ncbi:MAG: hypothetical protein F9K23_14160 [Bacteroidetes bacterium]|nr:MAG: hypothetical protein F9K23_14160 [Bacteroidota bacterium]